MKPLSEEDLLINQQAAAVAASVVSEPVVAATRCETRPQIKGGPYSDISGRHGGFVRTARKDRKWTDFGDTGGLPSSFILAVTAGSVYALEDRRKGGQLVPGNILKSWDRSSFRARVNAQGVPESYWVPDDRRELTVFLPMNYAELVSNRDLRRLRDAFGDRVETAEAQVGFLIGRDAATQQLIDALTGRTSGRPSGAAGGQAAGRAPATASVSQQLSTEERLQKLDSLRATGVISDAEYTAKRSQIIGEL